MNVDEISEEVRVNMQMATHLANEVKRRSLDGVLLIYKASAIKYKSGAWIGLYIELFGRYNVANAIH